jgi:hypothetical protein
MLTTAAPAGMPAPVTVQPLTTVGVTEDGRLVIIEDPAIVFPVILKVTAKHACGGKVAMGDQVFVAEFHISPVGVQTSSAFGP